MKAKRAKAGIPKYMMNLKSGGKKPAPGDRVVELENGDVLWVSARKIQICTCDHWKWVKETWGDTDYYFKVCDHLVCKDKISTGPLPPSR